MKYVSLFSGAGGFDLGFEQAGWDVERLVEVWEPAVATLWHNRPGWPIRQADIATVTGAELHTGGTLDAVVGGPPCQGFSVAGEQQVDDPRNALLGEYARLVGEAHPRALLMEEVPAVLQMKFRPHLQALTDALRAHGYYVDWQVVPMADYGLPQARKRFILAGFRTPERLHVFWDAMIQAKTHVGRHVSALDGLAGVDPGPLQRIAPATRARFAATPGEGSPYGRRSAARLTGDRPARTITGSHDAPLHPTEHRRLTIPERAALQGFPPGWTFQGTAHERSKQVGNAVPPPIAKTLAGCLAVALA